MFANVNRFFKPSPETKSQYIESKEAVFKRAAQIKEAGFPMKETGMFFVESPILQSMLIGYGAGLGFGLAGRAAPILTKPLPIISKLPAVGKVINPMNIVAGATVALPIAKQVQEGKYVEAGLNIGLMGISLPYAMAGYRAGLKMPLPGRTGLLEQAERIKSIREYNKYVAEEGVAKKFGTFQPESDISKYNLMVKEAAFKTKPITDIFPISRFAKGREGGFLELRGTVESHNILTAEQPITFKKLSLYKSIKTGIRLPKPFSQSELLYTKGRSIEEYNLMVREPSFKNIGLKTSITEYNKLVAERTLPSKVKVPVNVLDILMVSGSGRVRPGQRMVMPSRKIEKRAFTRLGGQTGYKLTSRMMRDGYGIVLPLALDHIIPSIEEQKKIQKRREKLSPIEKGVVISSDIQNVLNIQRKEQFDIYSQRSRQTMEQAQNQIQEQMQEQTQRQIQITKQIERIKQPERGRTPEKQPIEPPKVPIITLPGFPTVDILGITKKKKKLKTKKTVTITPYATVEDIFNLSNIKRVIPTNATQKLDILNISKKRDKK